MTSTILYTKMNNLPASMLKEVDDFIDFLTLKRKNKITIKERKFGCGKGLFVMHDDFDMPLDDFREYM